MSLIDEITDILDKYLQENEGLLAEKDAEIAQVLAQLDALQHKYDKLKALLSGALESI